MVWKTYGSYLSHLRFHDVVLMYSDLDVLKELLQYLNEEPKEVGVQMNLEKSKLISIEANVQIEIAYLDHVIKSDRETKRRK